MNSADSITAPLTADSPTEVRFTEESFARKRSTDIACLLGFALVLSLFGLGSGPGLGDHEAIVALGARDIRQYGNWLIPQVGDEAFVRKTPLAFWTAALSSMILDPSDLDPPVSEMASRFPSALSAVLTVLIVYGLGRAMFGHETGIISGLVMASCAGAFFYGHNAQVDMQLTLWMTAAYSCFWVGAEQIKPHRVFMILFYVALALAMLAKAPLPLAFVCLPILVWWFVVVPVVRLGGDRSDFAGFDDTLRSRFARQVARTRLLHLGLGSVVFLFIFLPWPVYAYLRQSGVLDLWRIEYLDRYSGALSEHGRPVWYYLPILLGLVFPFSLSVPEAIASPFITAYRQHRRALLFLATMFVLPFLFVTTSSFKRPHYLLGCIPTISLMLGPALHRLFVAERSFACRWLRLASIAIITGTIGVVVIAKRGVADENVGTASAFSPIAILLAVGIVVAVAAFSSRHRLASLIALVVTLAITFTWSWTTLGNEGLLDSRVSSMIEQLRSHRIGPEEKLVWVTGRPDARLTYYYGIRCERLFSAIELAPRRQGRQSVAQPLLSEAVEEVRSRMKQSPSTLFVVKGTYWDAIAARELPGARRLFRVGGEEGGTENDWVVFRGRSCKRIEDALHRSP